jgi:hypothetical protein
MRARRWGGRWKLDGRLAEWVVVEIKCGMGVGAVTGGFLSCKTAVGGGGGWSMGGSWKGSCYRRAKAYLPLWGCRVGNDT